MRAIRRGSSISSVAAALVFAACSVGSGTTLDAGLDATVDASGDANKAPDAGALDAGAQDAGGSSDASALDSGTVDSGADTTSYIDDLGLIAYGGSSGSWQNLDSYGMIDMGGASDAPTVAPHAGKSICYQWYLGARGAEYLGLDPATARANGWLVHTASGAEITFSGSPLADVGNSGYQAAVLSAVRAFLSANPSVQGIFPDDFLPDWNVFASGVGLPVYTQSGSLLWSNNTDFQNAMLSFAQHVWGPLKDAGYLVVPNAEGYFSGGTTDHGVFTSGVTDGSWPLAIHNGDTTKEWLDHYHSYVTGMMVEHWCQHVSSPWAVGLNTHATAFDYWNEWTSVVDYVQSYGLGFYPANYMVPSTPSVARYMRASFLMKWNGGAGAILFGNNGSYTTDPWNSEFTYDPGQPRSPMVAVGAGWKRQYEHYVIYINPSGSTQVLDGHTIASGDALFVP